MTTITISRSEFEAIKQLFDEAEDLQEVTITQTNLSGIGKSTEVEIDEPEPYSSGARIIDITDYSSW